MRWNGLRNGDLLARTELEFDAFVTADRNLAFQQNLPKFGIAVVILKCHSNRLQELLALMPEVNKRLRKVEKGKTIAIGS